MALLWWGCWSEPAGAANAELIALCLADQPPTLPSRIWEAWSLAPEVVFPLVATLALYTGGILALRRRGEAGRVRPWRLACFAGGWLVLAAALVSPLCRIAATLVSAHMLQHLVLVALAPPLLILGKAGIAIPAVFPPRLRDRVMACDAAAFVAKVCRRLHDPAAAAALYGGLIWLWHIPRLYQDALQDPLIHLSMYGSLLAASLLFWSSLIRAASHRSDRHIEGLVASLVTTAHTGLLGALLTFSPAPWYTLLGSRAGAWGITALEDQQLAGLIMWVPMGFLYVGAATALAAAWLVAVERRTAPLMHTPAR